jgi:transcription elongation factor Elf1
VIVDRDKPVQGAPGKETGEQMEHHTCIATPKEMIYRIVCAECGLSTETDSDKWTPAQGTFKCPRCKANYPITPHARAKGNFWG